MKSKKLLISLVAVAILVVIIVVLVAVFTVQDVVIVYHEFDGKQSAAPQDGLSPDEVASDYRGKSIVFLSKTSLLTEFNENEKYSAWYAFAVVKQFPNVVEVHVVRRTAVAVLNTGNENIYIDQFGNVVPQTENVGVVDITSAFGSKEVQSKDSALVFSNQESNRRLSIVLRSISATWQCWVEIPDMTQILGEKDVFAFDEKGNLEITPRNKGKIVVMSPDREDLEEKIIEALGVYYNDTKDVQSDNYTITVHENGSITTPSR